MVGHPDFRYHLKSRPFATQALLDHSKSRLVTISDPHSIRLSSSYPKYVLSKPFQERGPDFNSHKLRLLKRNQVLQAYHCHLRVEEGFPEDEYANVSQGPGAFDHWHQGSQDTTGTRNSQAADLNKTKLFNLRGINNDV